MMALRAEVAVTICKCDCKSAPGAADFACGARAAARTEEAKTTAVPP